MALSKSLAGWEMDNHLGCFYNSSPLRICLACIPHSIVQFGREQHGLGNMSHRGGGAAKQQPMFQYVHFFGCWELGLWWLHCINLLVYKHHLQRINMLFHTVYKPHSILLRSIPDQTKLHAAKRICPTCWPLKKLLCCKVCLSHDWPKSQCC